MDGLWRQVGDLARRGVSRDSVAGRLDLSPYAATFPALRGGINPANVTRAYDVVTGRAN